jgi:hypothetical protein
MIGLRVNHQYFQGLFLVKDHHSRAYSKAVDRDRKLPKKISNFALAVILL